MKKIASWTDKQNNILDVIQMNFAELQDHHYTWALNQSWTPAKDSVSAVFAMDNTGFYCLKKNNETIVTLSAVKYPLLNTAHLGFFISKQNYRGQGYGKLLWQNVVEKLSQDGYTLTLDCLDQMLPLYQKLGFEKIGQDTIWTYTANNETTLQTGSVDNSIQISEVDTSNHALLQSVVSFDAEHIHASSERRDFLDKWMIKDHTTTVVAHNDAGHVIGYAVLSRRLTTKGESGYRIGPMAVNDAKASELILNHLKYKAGTESLFIDTCNNQPIATNLMKASMFKPIAILNRMSTQHDAVHKVNEANIGLTSLAYAPF